MARAHPHLADGVPDAEATLLRLRRDCVAAIHAEDASARHDATKALAEGIAGLMDDGLLKRRNGWGWQVVANLEKELAAHPAPMAP